MKCVLLLQRYNHRVVQWPYPFRWSPCRLLLKLNIYDHQGSLRQAMAGCISIRRKEEFTPTSRLQRLSATLIVFSEASENPAAWVFLLLFKIWSLWFSIQGRWKNLVKWQVIRSKHIKKVGRSHMIWTPERIIQSLRLRFSEAKIRYKVLSSN